MQVASRKNGVDAELCLSPAVAAVPKTRGALVVSVGGKSDSLSTVPNCDKCQREADGTLAGMVRM